jgi:glutamate synthase (NADPH/NADH) large chain
MFTGDGAGILVQIPHRLILSKGIKVPDEGKYATGLVFFPREEKARLDCEQVISDIIAEEKITLIGLSDVPADNSCLGEIAMASEPFIRQIFITFQGEQDELERKAYLLRKQAENIYGVPP